MAKPRLSAEEKLARKQARDRAYNEYRKAKRREMSTPRVLLTEEEKRERKRARDKAYAKKRAKVIKSQIHAMAESKIKMRRCRHEHANGDTCGAPVALTSYYFCAKHRKDKNWGTEEVVFTVGVQNASF